MPMIEYVSTRGGGGSLSYDDVLLEGLSKYDGGLWVPSEYPQLSEQEQAHLHHVTYPALFSIVSGSFADGTFSSAEMHDFAAHAYAPANFPDAKSALQPEIVPVQEIGDGFFVQDLSKGPTAAFKDMALGPLALQIDEILARRNQKLAMFGATSGDTGSSAERAFKGLERIRLAMQSPFEGGMTDFQRDQMSELTGGNIYNLSVKTNFDGCQQLVKDIVRDPEFAALGAVNSINWGRVAAQVTYYFSGYLQVAGTNIGQEVDFTVPTGNFGNVLAGHIARKMGLPIRRLIVATNENNVLDRFIKTGEYVEKTATSTSSPSMDISTASNLERLLVDIFDGDTNDVSTFMATFEAGKTGHRRASLVDMGLSPNVMQTHGFDSDTSNHSQRLATIYSTFKRGRLIDPHTADAVAVGKRKKDPGVPMVCMSTAKPVKFPDTMAEALGFVPPVTDSRFVGMENRAAAENKGFVVLDPHIDKIKGFLREHVLFS